MTHPVRSSLLLAVIAVLLAGAAPALLAQGGPGQPPPAVDPAAAWGAKLFDDAIRYVARGGVAIPEIRDFYAKLDAKIELDTSRQEGQMRMWFLAPSMYRQEITTNGATTTKILGGQVGAELGWIKTPDGRTQNLKLSAEGQQSIRQLGEDRDRLADLAQFLTLGALKGPGVQFVYDGYKQGSGTYAGNWVKVTRRAPGKTNLVFWLAYERDAQNNPVATWPGIVRVEGDPAKNYPTEDYILKEWDSAQSQQNRQFRYPRRIEAYSILKDASGQPRPTRFLFAVVEDIKINAGIDATRFQPN